MGRFAEFLRLGDPVISVDTKKKELIGAYYSKGRQWWVRNKRTR
jgi:hypothetical protein